MSFAELYQNAQKLPKFYQDKKFFQEASTIYKCFLLDQDEATAIYHLKAILAFHTKSEHIIDASLALPPKQTKTKTDKHPAAKFRVKAIDLNRHLPGLVDIKDIQANGFLLTNEKINLAKKLVKASKRDNIKIDKEKLDADFYVLCLKGKCYAVYKGEGYILGKGFFGKVKLMQDLDTGKWYALKVTNIDENTILSDITNERQNLVEIGLEKGMLIRKPDTTSAKKHDHKAFIGMELAAGIPLSKLKECKLSANELVDVIIAVLEAIHALHKQGLLHRDIKPANIIYNPFTKTVTLVDVGLMVKGPSYKDEATVGTAGFIAPEAVAAHIYDEKTEMYAASKTLANALDWVKSYKKDELTEDEYYSNHYKILDRSQIQKPEWPAEILDNAIHYFQAMADVNPNNRPTFTMAADHFKTLKQKFVIELPNQHNIGLVDLKELIKADGQINDDFILPLAMLNKVWIYAEDNKSAQKAHINKLIRQLEEKGIRVAGVLEKDKVNNILKPGLGKPEHDIPDYLEAHNTDNNINSYFYFTTTNATINSAIAVKVNAGKKSMDYQYNLDNPGIISPTQFDILINGLYQAIASLEKKIIESYSHYSHKTSEQIACIQTAMQKFQQFYIAKELTSKVVDKQLAYLQKQLCQHKPKNVSFFKASAKSHITDEKQTVNALRVKLQEDSPAPDKKAKVGANTGANYLTLA